MANEEPETVVVVVVAVVNVHEHQERYKLIRLLKIYEIFIFKIINYDLQQQRSSSKFHETPLEYYETYPERFAYSNSSAVLAFGDVDPRNKGSQIELVQKTRAKNITKRRGAIKIQR